MNRFYWTRNAGDSAYRRARGAPSKAKKRLFFAFALACVLAGGCALFPDLDRLSGAKVEAAGGSCAIVGDPLYVKARAPHPWALYGAAVAATDGLFVVSAPTDSSASAPEREALNPSVGCPNREIPTQMPAGAVYVYEKQGSAWKETQLDIDFASVTPYLAIGLGDPGMSSTVFPTTSIAVSGKRVVVGLGGDNSLGVLRGSVRIFEKTAALQWKEMQRIDGRETMEGDLFGMSVSLSGTTLVVGAPGHDGNKADGGAAYAADSGAAYAADSGAAYVADSGAAYVYEFDGTQFAYVRPLEPEEPQKAGYFGTSVAQSDDFIAVGAPKENVDNQFGSLGDQGVAYTFTKSHFDRQRLPSTTTATPFGVGFTVAIDKDLLAVGAPWTYGCVYGRTGYDRGAVLLYSLKDGQWVNERCVGVSDAKVGLFGYGVALASGTLVVGAPFSWGSEAGKQPVIEGDAAIYYDASGGAYVFSGVDAKHVPEPCLLKAPNVGTCDDYGVSVALGGGNVLIGAAWEDSAKGGIRKTPASDDEAANSGAVYLYPTTK